jgi:hypothetical protein
MRKRAGGRRRQSRAVSRFKLEDQRHNSEANQADRQLALSHIMANKATVRAVIAGLCHSSIGKMQDNRFGRDS